MTDLAKRENSIANAAVIGATAIRSHAPSTPFRGFAVAARQLPRMWLNLFLVVLAGMVEGVGLALFIPLLEHLDGRIATGGFITRIQALFAAANIPFGTVSLLAAIVGLALASLSLLFLQHYLITRLQFQYLRRLRDSVTRALLRSTWPHVSSLAHGDIANLLVTEGYRASNAITYQVLFIASLIQAVIYAVLSTLLSWALVLLCLAFTAVTWLAVRPLNRRAHAFGSFESRHNKSYHFHIIDYLRALKLVKVTGAEAALDRHLGELSQGLSDIQCQRQINHQLSHLLVQAAPVILLSAVIVASHEVLSIPTSVMLVFLLIVIRMVPRLIQAQQHFQGYLSTVPALAVVDARLNAAEASAEDVHEDGRAFERLAHAVTLNDVTFRYPGTQEPVLNRVNLEIPRGHLIALVGASGAGKSTLIDLLAGLQRPDNGSILIDGMPLAAWNLTSWRQRLGYVGQETTAFNDTLRSNLLFARPGASEGEIRHALRLAHLDEFVATLPDGLNTFVGENGVRLSGGQRQRLALARALLVEPELLLLDEATSALDNESERQIQAAIEALRHRMTVVIIAHRLSTVRRADRIYVLADGRVMESGSYESLLASDTRFAALYRAQQG